MLRDFYRRGQRLFRAALQAGWVPNYRPQQELLSELVEGLTGTQREGLEMGFQSDAYAYNKGIPLSIEGVGTRGYDGTSL